MCRYGGEAGARGRRRSILGRGIRKGGGGATSRGRYMKWGVGGGGAISEGG